MKSAASFGILMAATTIGAVGAGAQDTRLTILQDGRVLVSRTVVVAVPRGTSTHQLSLGTLDPGSLVSLDPEVAIRHVEFVDGTDTPAIMARGIGRSFLVRTRDDSVSLTLLGIEPMRWRWPDGTVSYGLPDGRLGFPPDLVPATPALTLTIDARRDREGLALAYLREGATWDASYSVLLAEDGAVMQGLATITSTRLAAEDADVALLAGSVSRAGGPGVPVARVMREAQGRAEPTARPVGDVQVYPLSEAVTLAPGQSSTVALVAPTAAASRRRYVALGSLPWSGSLGGAGGQTDLAVRVGYLVARPQGSVLGDQPLPGGVVRLYRRDEDERLRLIGESRIPHSPAGQDLELDAGLAFDLTGKRWMTNFQQMREDNRRVEDATFTVTLTNGGTRDVTVEVVERRRGEWSVLESSLPWEQVSATEIRIPVAVPAGSDVSFTYRLKVYP
jgi:hypothetical protein